MTVDIPTTSSAIGNDDRSVKWGWERRARWIKYILHAHTSTVNYNDYAVDQTELGVGKSWCCKCAYSVDSYLKFAS